MSVKRIIFLLLTTCFVFSCATKDQEQALVISDPQSVAKKIADYRTMLANIPLIEISDRVKIDDVPDLSSFEEVSPILYGQSIRERGRGGESIVYEARSEFDRPEVGLVADQLLAVRAARVKTGDERIAVLLTLRNFARSLRLREPTVITEFFPEFYGAYQGYGETEFGRERISFQEIELVDTTFANEFKCKDGEEKIVIPNCTVLETCLGEWIGARFVGIGDSVAGLRDSKPDNFGLKRVDYSRSYLFPSKTLSFSSEWLPKRIDIGGAKEYLINRQTPIQKFDCSIRIIASSEPDRCLISQEAREFVTALNSAESLALPDFYAFYDHCEDNQVLESHREYKIPRAPFR